MARHSNAAAVAIRRQSELLQKCRDSLSVEKFLSVLSQVALNGTLPKYDRKGNLIEEDEPEAVEPKLRLQTTQYLVDKVMSNPAPTQPVGSREDVLDPGSLRTLSNEELKAIAFGAIKESVSRSISGVKPGIEGREVQSEEAGEDSVGGVGSQGVGEA